MRDLPLNILLIGILGLLFASPRDSQAQSQLPAAGWRYHLAYLEGAQLTGDQQRVFVQGPHSLLLTFPREDRWKTFTKQDALRDQRLSRSVYAPAQELLVLAYPDSRLHLLGQQQERILGALANASPRPEIQSLNLAQDAPFALVGLSKGLAVIDLDRLLLSETFLNIGPAGSALPIQHASLREGRYLLTHPESLLLGNSAQNLRDFRSWTRLDPPPGERFLRAELQAEAHIIALMEGGSLYHKRPDSPWEALFFPEPLADMRRVEDQLYLRSAQAIYLLSESTLAFEEVARSQEPLRDFWPLGQRELVLLLPNRLEFQGVPLSLPEGISTNRTKAFHARGATFMSEERAGDDILLAGKWSPLQRESSSFPDLIGVAASGKEWLAGSAEGVLVLDIEPEKEAIQSRRFADSDNARVAAIPAELGWPVFQELDNPVHLQLLAVGENRLRNLQIPGLAPLLRTALQTEAGPWFFLEAAGATFTRLRIYFPETGQNLLVSGGNLGIGLLMDFCLDEEGTLWLLGQNGIRALERAFTLRVTDTPNWQSPSLQGRAILEGNLLSSIRALPDGSLWVATQDAGLFAFEPRFGGLRQQWRQEDSPLISNDLRRLSYEPVSGELFIQGEGHLSSFNTPFTGSFSPMENILVYPNPIRPAAGEQLTIEGLENGSQVLVSTLSGRVLFRTEVRGGRVVWPPRDSTGEALQVGVYLIFARSATGTERLIGRFTVN
ncbi:MAG: PorZ beta-propeller-like domain-containing protein [Nitritalea sp.]